MQTLHMLKERSQRLLVLVVMQKDIILKLNKNTLMPKDEALKPME
jgi:hypothetical protein